MDCSVVATRFPGLFFVSTTDFFYPLIESPYAQGRIAACNVLSDIYAMGIVEIDTVLMLLATSSDMLAEERDIVTTQMIKGFNDLCKEANTSVTGGQTVSNPWPIIGGVASSTITEQEMIRPENLQAGDVLVLTKPLGTQVAVNLWQWRRGTGRHWEKLVNANILTIEDIGQAYDTAIDSMTRLNRNVARAMHMYQAHGSTDVTGFGILGHANNLASHSHNKIRIIIDTLPTIKHTYAADKVIGNVFKLGQGLSAETSGGILVALKDIETAEKFIHTVQELDNRPAWIIGKVVECKENETPGASIVPEPKIIEV